MQLTKKLMLLPLLFSASLEAKLPELQTKQSLNKIRYISSDGKVTYYVRGSGALQLSTNYSFNSIIKADKYTDYQLNVSDEKKYIAITQMSSQNRNINFHRNYPILLSAFGKESKAVKIGEGVQAKLQLKDSWLSYYDQKKLLLKFFNIKNPKRSKSLQLKKKLNEFHIPMVEMITPNDIIYTDENEKGYSAVILNSLLDKEQKVVYKSKTPGNKLEFCVLKNTLYIGEFPHDSVNGNTTILKVDLFNNEDFKKNEIIYSSSLSDIGNMICTNEKIFFIKTVKYHSDINLKETEVASLSFKDQTTKVLTTEKYATQIVKMGDLILLPIKDKVLILEGNANLLDDEISIKKEGE